MRSEERTDRAALCLFSLCALLASKRSGVFESGSIASGNDLAKNWGAGIADPGRVGKRRVVRSIRYPPLSSSSPRRRGSRKRPETEFLSQITPIRITVFDQSEFPSAVPLLEALFADDCRLHRVMRLKPDKQLGVVPFGKASEGSLTVLVNAGEQIRRDPDVKRAVALRRHDVNARLKVAGHRWRLPLLVCSVSPTTSVIPVPPTSSFPRRRESRKRRGAKEKLDPRLRGDDEELQRRCLMQDFEGCVLRRHTSYCHPSGCNIVRRVVLCTLDRRYKGIFR